MRLILFNPWINFKNDKKFNFKLKSNDIFLGDWCLRNYNFTEKTKGSVLDKIARKYEFDQKNFV